MQFENAHDFERHVAVLLQTWGWKTTMPPKNQKGYDIEAAKNGRTIAIQVKNYKVPVKVPQIERFFEFLDLPIAERFDGAYFVAANGYSKQALALVEEVNQPNFRLLTTDEAGKLIAIGENPKPPETSAEPLYLGVFTCKGGVGKTTISAHLAGAMAISGYDVALLDLDPQKNLSTLLGDGVKLPGRRGKPGNTVTVYSLDEWKEGAISDEVKMVVCDCSPSINDNPKDLLAKFSYCIIPTALNPLGLNKNGHVIKSTIREIRKYNPDAHLFVLINNYMRDETYRSEVLKEQYNQFFTDLAKEDKNFKFIDPDEVAIRNSKQLFYWGYHIYSGDRYQLAFNTVGGRCHPKADFLSLLEYLESQSTIESVK